MRVVVLLLTVASALAGPARHGGQRIVGGAFTTIDQYPYAAAMLFQFGPTTFGQNCGGAILNEKSILSAAHCHMNDKTDPRNWRVRVGSTFASSGGQVHNVESLINHPEFNPNNLDNDIAVVILVTFMVFNNVVKQASIAGATYVVEVDASIVAVGWGVDENTQRSEQLKQAQLRVISQSICQRSFPFNRITDGMLCVGSDINEGTCTGDSGGPNIHNGTVVGVTSFGLPVCAQAGQPAVTARVSHYISWILENVYEERVMLR